MVESLFLTKNKINSDVVVIYSDIVFDLIIIKKISKIKLPNSQQTKKSYKTLVIQVPYQKNSFNGFSRYSIDSKLT